MSRKTSPSPLCFQGDMLRKARREMRMTQSELADEIGVHRITMARWESGTSEPTSEQIDQIAFACRTPRVYFLGEAAEALSPESQDWLMDPWLKKSPLEDLQRLTGPALRSLGRTSKEIARIARLPHERIEALLSDAKPTPREIQRLRDTLGQNFNPSPALRPSDTSILTLDEKVDILLQRLARIEGKLEDITAQLSTAHRE